ncbi:MAG: hypothetical protein QOF42_140 [Gammaproteobacteria bacterium]|nr:hypothetical protein [Gammaproteobacteria bacterium]
MLLYERRMFRRQSGGGPWDHGFGSDDSNAETIAPDTTLRERADLIDRRTVGALPICDG